MNKNWQHISLGALLVVLIVPFYIAMGFTFPLGDDFARANYSRGIFDIGKAVEEMVHAWTSWSGRYTHHFLIIFLGKAAESRLGYTLVCAAGVSLYWFSFYGIFHELLGRKRPGDSFLIASVCTLAFLCGHPALNTSYYLITDIFGIGIGNGLVLSFIWALCCLWNANCVSRKLKTAVFGTGVAAIGCYEHAAIATFLAASLACALAYCFSHPHKKVYLQAVKVVTVFFLISFLAMGNFKRQVKRAVTLELILEQLSESWSVWKAHAFSVFSSIWGLGVLFVGILISPAPQWRMNASGGFPVPLMGGVVVFLALTSGIVVVQALSDVPVTATPKLTASMSLLSSYALGFMAILTMAPLRRKLPTVPVSLLSVPLIIAFVLTPNYQRLLHDLFSGSTAAYAASLEKRYTFLKWSGLENPGGTAKVSRLLMYPYPSSLGEAIPSSPEEWPVRHVSRMFKLGKVVSASPDLAMAVAAVTQKAPKGGAAAETSNQMLAFKDITAGPNDTFRFHWLMVDASFSPADTLSTLVLIRRQLDRPVPVFIQRMIEKEVLTRDAITKGGLLEYAGIMAQHLLHAWTLSGDGQRGWLIPVAAPEWGEIIAVYASLDGTEFRKVPFIE